MAIEQWNVPNTYEEIVANGDCQYSILGVETHNNMDSMNRFIEVVQGLSDKIEVDDGTQIIVTHTDLDKVIVIDAHGLGDFYDSGFDVTVIDRNGTGLLVPEQALSNASISRIREYAPDLYASLTALLTILGGDRSTTPACVEARAVLARARGEVL